jgi:hypothetical protein
VRAHGDVLGRIEVLALFFCLHGHRGSSRVHVSHIQLRDDWTLAGGYASPSDVPGDGRASQAPKAGDLLVGAQSPTRLHVACERWKKTCLYGCAIWRWGLRCSGR